MADRRNFLNDVNSAGSVIAANGVYTESYKVAYGQKGSEAASIDYSVADKRFNIMVGNQLGGINVLDLKLGNKKYVTIRDQGDTDSGKLIINVDNTDLLVVSDADKAVRPATDVDNQIDLGKASVRWKNVYATSFIGNLTGNADTATKLLNVRKINGVNFDGSQDISISNLTSKESTGNKLIYVKAPSYDDIDPTHTDTTYFEALLKWLCKTYPNHEYCTFIVEVSPNSRGTAIVHIYSTSIVKNELPEYSTGLYISLSGYVGLFKTSTYNYFYTTYPFSTIPISKGGTGATTAAQALTNLGAAAKSDLNKYLPLAGGTLTGDVSSHNLKPVTTNTYELGTSALKWKNIYATTFTGDLTGKAATATKLAAATRIDGIAFDGSAAVNRYAVCETAAGTAAKTVTVTNFNLVNRSKGFYKIYSYKYS